MPMDPLSDVLSLLKPRSYGASGFDLAGDWSFRFPRHQGIKCYAVMAGECWLSVDTVAEAVRLKAGDCFLLPRGLPFRLASDLHLPSIPYTELLTGRVGGIARWKDGGEVFLAGGHFSLSEDHADVLLGMLPPIVHICREPDKEDLRWSLERLRQELSEPRPGSFLAAQHLTDLMLLQALRLHLDEGPRGGIGWLFALADRQIGAAIGAMHQDPARRWTLEALAAHVGMSRAVFALKFKQTVGRSPMEYLTHWRMLCAGDRLANSGGPISAIARSLGYMSESAFSTAFKRVMGCSPRQYVRRQIIASTAPGEDGTETPDRLRFPERLHNLGLWPERPIADTGYGADVD
jgi:AraC-like DNA-binding protein